MLQIMVTLNNVQCSLVPVELKVVRGQNQQSRSPKTNIGNQNYTLSNGHVKNPVHKFDVFVSLVNDYYSSECYFTGQ